MSDGEGLLERVRALDEAALAAVFDEFYIPLYRYIYRHLGHVETAEDLAAEVFQRLLRDLHAGRGPRQMLRPWLFRVAHNLVIDETRRASHRQHGSLNDTMQASGVNIEEQAQQSVMAELACDALNSLTPKQRSIIFLKFFEGMSNAEVASVMGLPVSAVKSLQHRALGALRRLLTVASRT